MTKQTPETQLKNAYRVYLSTLSIGVLRSLGRQIGVYKSTVKKKEELVEQIVAIETGELLPARQSSRGAPVKDSYVDPRIFERLEEIKCVHLSAAKEQTSVEPVLILDGNKEALEVNSPELNGVRFVDRNSLIRLRGRLESKHGACMLVPFEAGEIAESAVVPEALVNKYSLCVGNTAVCHAERRFGTLVAIDVLSVNELIATLPKEEPRFEDADVVYPWEAFRFCSEKERITALKYLDWLVPVAKGQRCVVFGKTESGKSLLLKEMAKSILASSPEARLFALMCERAPEEIAEMRKILPPDRLVFSSYDDDPEEQIRAFDALLDELKEAALDNRDVCLIVDSLTALAQVFNQTERSSGGKTLPCGLESKTLQYLKKYFGSARAMAGGGSLTVIAAMEADEDNATNAVLAREIGAIANSVIYLSSPAYSRGAPLVELSRSETKKAEKILKEDSLSAADRVRRIASEKLGDRALFELVESSSSLPELLERAERSGK